ncbi:MAG: ATP-binding protein [Ginsengibacter sp.]
MVKIFDKIANRTRIGFLGAFLLLLLSYILTFISTNRVIEQNNTINHTNRIIHDLDNILGFITHAESSFRGYILSDNEDFYDDFKESVAKTDSSLKVLNELTRDNSIHQQNLEILSQLKVEKFSLIQKLIDQYAASHVIDRSLLKENFEGGIADKIESKVVAMQSTERDLWHKRSEQFTQYSGFIRFLNIASFIIALLLTIYSLFVFNKENKAKNEQEEKTVEFRQQLENRVDQLADLNKELIELRSLEKYAVTGRIARVIAHEVRNPLTNINLSVEQLRSEEPGSENSKLFFDMIARNSDRINVLVSDLLNASRTTELNFEAVAINELLDESLAAAHDRIELNQINVVKQYDPEICSISIDKEKVKVVFLNLIVNSIEAMEEKGELIIKTESKNSRCVITVIDNGKGMSPENAARLFEPYFTTKEKGNGLGLANSQNVIISHGGSISAQSELNVGTTFTISFNFA